MVAHAGSCASQCALALPLAVCKLASVLTHREGSEPAAGFGVMPWGFNIASTLAMS